MLQSKIDLVLSKLSNLETKMEELNTAVKGLQSKVTSLEREVDSVKMKQKASDDNFTSMKKKNGQAKKGKWKRKDHYCAFLKIFRPRMGAQTQT